MLIIDSLVIFQQFSIQYSADKTYLVRNCAVVSVLSVFIDYTTKKANGTSVVSWINQNSSYRGNLRSRETKI